MIAGGAAAAGAIGGIVLSARMRRSRKKLLGIPIARRGLGLRPLAHEVRKARQQIERMADQAGRARAEERRESPIEVVLSALTARRQPRAS